jgi:hypothetical protein
MPKIEIWANLPPKIRQHLIDRMRERSISLSDLNQLRLWMESRPEVPTTDWFKDFGTFKICGRGPLPKRSCFEANMRPARPSKIRRFMVV